MKKKIFSGVFALALLVATGYGVNQSLKSDANLSDLALSNVEALSQSESGGDYCDNYCMLADGWKCTVYSNGVPWLSCYSNNTLINV